MAENGTVVKEGTPEQWNETAWNKTYVPEELGPHEIWKFDLVYFVGKPKMTDETAASWTVEIIWGGRSKQLPLIGSCQPHFHMYMFLGDFDKNIPWQEQVDFIDIASWSTQMVNF